MSIKRQIPITVEIETNTRCSYSALRKGLVTRMLPGWRVHERLNVTV